MWVVKGGAMKAEITWDEKAFASYRSLLDEEEAAFDDLEHAFEEGDSDRFEKARQKLLAVLRRKESYLHSSGLLVSSGAEPDRNHAYTGAP
jgi:hypothetical protein